MLNSSSKIDPIDYFDSLPDPLLLIIFNYISDIKTLIRCRALSKRFNSLVPQSDSLRLRVDRVVSVTEPDDDDPFVLTFLRSIFKSLHDLISPKPLPTPTRSVNSPAQILRGFDRIRELEIELPSGDLRLEKGIVLRWKAEFGRNLRSCVILGFRAAGCGGREVDLGGAGGGGLKMRVVWTISALIAASARRYMLREVVREHEAVEKLVVRDREGEGTIVMDKDGLKESREGGGGEPEEEEEVKDAGDGVWWRSNRTTVPAVRMRMRHVARLELENGMRMDCATLVVVRPTGGGPLGTEAEEHSGDAALAYGAFGGVYQEAVEKLLRACLVASSNLVFKFFFKKCMFGRFCLQISTQN